MLNKQNLCKEFFTSNNYSKLSEDLAIYINKCKSYEDIDKRNLLLKAIELELPSKYIKYILHNTNVSVYAKDSASHNVWDYFEKQSKITHDSMCSQKIVLNYLRNKAQECYDKHAESIFPHSIICAEEMSLLEFSDTYKIDHSNLCPEITTTDTDIFTQYSITQDNTEFLNNIRSLFNNDEL